MKYLTLLLFLTSCGPYYVGTKPVDPAEELMASRPVVAIVPEVVEAKAPDQKVTAAPAPLIGWDGKEVTSDDRPLHGLDPGEDTHGNLLSMYMDSKEEVDQLKLELAAMADLRQKQDSMLEASQAEIVGRDSSIATLQGQLDAERMKSQDLEARLVTAQIRRLEAEKQLLLNILGVEPEAESATEPTVARANP
jgi:hypothetical protein